MKRNYDTYHFTAKEWMLYLAESLAICGGINYLLVGFSRNASDPVSVSSIQTKRLQKAAKKAAELSV